MKHEAVSLTLKLLDQIFSSAANKDIGVRLWDGTCWPDAQPKKATIVLKNPGALRAMFLPGTELELAEAYLFDDFDVEGDIIQVFDLEEIVVEATSGFSRKLRIARELLSLPDLAHHDISRRANTRLSGRRHSIERDRQAVTYHYDQSNDFYALWLDQRMVYSCAYFPTPDTDLDSAQEHKLDYICRKLRLKPGQRLLDIGCGWGGLVIHAAQKYDVDATGITLSQPQAELANRRIAQAGLANRCRVEVRDYRQMDELEGYDALVSVGMFEHVGEALLPLYFQKAFSLLKAGGVFLNHGIASNATVRTVKGPTFNDAYVFPDGELVPIHITLRAAELSGFEVRDVESLREHYALTLRHWVQRLEAHHEDALQYVDEFTYRIWRLFMSGSSHGFSRGRLNVYQALLVKPGARGESKLPLTRIDWYAS